MFKLLSNSKLLIILLIIVAIGISSCAKEEKPTDDPHVRFQPGVYPDSTITDGPFISIIGNQYTIRWIEKNKSVVEKLINGNEDGSFEADFGFPFEYVKSFQDRLGNINYVQEFKDVNKLVALSDIHGQYEIFFELLRNNGVVDENFKWIFGSGHLVINGDIFDRGNRVTEILWQVFKLEHQAEEAGGKVHFLLGNHEVMVMNNDLRYIDYKYVTNARRLGTTYDQLYSKNTIMGQWLRTKPVIVKINDMIFNHAGISPDFVNKNLSIETTNQLFLEQIIDQDETVIESNPLLDFLTGSNGPIWYRGYFQDNSFTLNKLDRILGHLNASYIIVGHTSMDGIKFYFDRKIIAVDSSIKNGVSGEILIYNYGTFDIGFIN